MYLSSQMIFKNLFLNCGFVRWSGWLDPFSNTYTAIKDTLEILYELQT